MSLKRETDGIDYPKMEKKELMFVKERCKKISKTTTTTTTTTLLRD